MRIGLTLALLYAAQVGKVEGQQAFEVSSVKPSVSDSGTETHRWPGGRFTATAVTLRALIQRAYEVQDFQIVGGPKWIDRDHYDVEAKSASLVRELNPLIQALLVERFGLKLHSETRELPMFSLVVERGGPRLTRTTTGGTGSHWNLGRGTLTGEKISIEMLATDLLQKALHAPVGDETGINGEYDINLTWTPDETGEMDPSDQPSFFTAIREQLGLRLVSRKGPVKVLIVDTVQRPQPN